MGLRNVGAHLLRHASGNADGFGVSALFLEQHEQIAFWKQPLPGNMVPAQSSTVAKISFTQWVPLGWVWNSLLLWRCNIDSVEFRKFL